MGKHKTGDDVALSVQGSYNAKNKTAHRAGHMMEKPMLRPDLITFTGADDATRIPEMVRLAQDFPVEFAILFSATREGDARYPTATWRARLSGQGLKLAAHVCGRHARDIVETGASELEDELLRYDRIQINTGAVGDLDLVAGFGDRISRRAGRRIGIILQTRDTFPEDERIEWLFDASGGRGIMPSAWPTPPANPNVRIGYAGGLGPDNVVQVISMLEQSPGAWIDMETRIRNEQDAFDLTLCRRVCEIVCERS